MIFQYLGTAAAEGFPAIFCSCDACERARKAGGRNLRTRSQAVIDGRLLLDFPADTNLHILNNGLDLRNIRTILITHCHGDHLYPGDLEMRNHYVAHMKEGAPLTVYGTAPTNDTILRTFELMHDSLDDDRMQLRTVEKFIPFSADGYTVVPLKAKHADYCDPVIYLIGDGKKTILYGHDSGYFCGETWDYLTLERPKLDFVSLDCTRGILESNHGGHMTIGEDAEVKKRLIDIGCADEHTVFCVNHFSHNGLADYDDLVPAAAERGLLVSYDGMKVEI